MTQLQLDCPFCSTKNAGFRVTYQWGTRVNSNQAYLLAICGVCTHGATLLSHATNSSSHANIVQHPALYPGNSYKLLKVWPSAMNALPEGVPDNISSFYVQGLENLQASRWDAAGAMFRKTLGTATKALASELKNISLYARISRLVADGLLTEAMGEWSHEIRIDGNDAVHDEEPETEADAKSTQKFTEAFLNYAFSLPQMVAANRANRQLTEAA